MSFTQKLVAAFGTALLTLLGIGVLAFQRTLQVDKDEEWVSHTHLTIETLDVVKTDIIDAQTSQRGYSITGNESYLESYRSTSQRVPNDIEGLEHLTSDNPNQQRLLSDLEPVVEAKFAEFNDRIEARRTIGLTVASAEQIETSNLHMDRIEILISQMRMEEQRLLAQRIKTVQIGSRNMKRVLVVGNILAFVFLLSAGLIVFDEMGKRKRSEETLRHNEERFRLMVSSVQDYAIIMLDPTGHIINWNSGAERMKGYRADEIVGQHFSRFYPAEDIDADKPGHELKTATELGRFEDEGWRLRKDGSRFWANVVITALRDTSGQLRGFVKVSRDLTERKQTEEKIRIHNAYLQAANKELEAFCYSVSHDLRAPLRGIDGFSQALIEEYETTLDDKAKGYLQRVRQSAQRMATLIDDLLNLSRITRIEMHRETVDLSAIADSIVGELHLRDPKRKVSFAIAPNLTANGDPRLLRIALENLLGNSWKFTSNRQESRIEIGRTQENGNSAYYIRDNGVGFDPAYAGKLFGAFQRLHAMNEFPGTGIGLASVQRIIHRHGGRIWADAKLGAGATFYFTL